MQNDHQFSGAYAAMNAYVAPARPFAQLWRLGVGVALIVIIYLGGVVLYLSTAGFGLFSVAQDAGSVSVNMAVDNTFIGATPRDMIILLTSFIFLILGAIIATAWPARRKIISLIGAFGPARTAFGRVLMAEAVLYVILLPLVLLGDAVTPNLPLMHMLMWLPLACAALLIQTASEELVFRGFIGQQLAARFASPIVWMVLPAVLFGSLHYDSETYGPHAYIAVLSTTLFALAAADLTARTGNLGAAIALHFANNFFVMLLVGQTGNMDGLALFTQPLDLGNPITIALDIAAMLAMWLAARFALRV